MKRVFAWVSAHRDQAISFILFALGFLALAITQAPVGFVRDESVYFEAAQRYAQWFVVLFQAPTSAFDDSVIAAAFEFNHEHPALMKSLFGLSERLFHELLGWLKPGAAFRLPAFAVSALIPAIIYRFGRAVYGRVAGLAAAVSFFLVPRQFFNAHLACFDVPIASAWLLVVYLFWRAQTKPRGWLWTGIAFGVALATKHNALFLPFLLAPLGLYRAWTFATQPGDRALFAKFLGLFVGVSGLYVLLYGVLGPTGFLEKFTFLSPHVALALVFVSLLITVVVRIKKASPEMFPPLAAIASMALLGPAIFYLLWPYLWHHPVDRTAWYLAFHAQHNHYAWFYLGRLLREPPFPLEYVFVKTALTVPVTLALPMAAGLLALAIRAFIPQLPRPSWTDALIAANALGSILIISHPEVPHFGGVKHWFASMPFLAMLAGTSIDRGFCLLGSLGQGPNAMRRVAQVLFLGLLGVPPLIAVWRNHPYGTSYYSELAGGIPGAATLGMQRQFWSNNVTGVLPWINGNASPGARVYLHEVNGLSFRDYQRNGMLRRDLQPAAGPSDANIAAYQYHQEFREQEFNIWQAFGTTKPVAGLYLDETPQVVVYRRP